MAKLTYRKRWGHERYSQLKGHPKRKARQLRSYDRGGCQPGCEKHPACKGKA